MVVQLLRLRLAQVFASSRGRRGGLVVAVLVGVAATATVIVVLGLVHDAGSVATARIVAVLLGSLVTLVSVLLPLVLATQSEFDPRRYLIFGLPRRGLAAGLWLSSTIGVVGLLLVVLAAGQAWMWADGPGLPFASLAAVLIVFGTRLLSLFVGALASSGIDSRRASQGGWLLTLALVVALAPVIPQLIVDASLDGFGWLDELADLLAWTPLAAAWAAPADAALGDAGLAVSRLLVATGYLLVLAVAWFWLVARAELRPGRGDTERIVAGLGWFIGFGMSPAGAVAARSLHYWGRDVRYRMALIAVVAVPALVAGVLAVAGVEARLLPTIVLPIASLFLGWATVHNDVVLDSTAFWMHVSAGIRGVEDRLGRVVPPLLIGTPLILVGAPLAAWAAGSWVLLPGIVGVCAGLLGGALGVGSVASALTPYPDVRPGMSAFAPPQTVGSGSGMTQFLSIAGAVVVAAPAIVGLALAAGGSGDWSVFALVTGVGFGLAALGAGIVQGGKVFDRRAPELLAFTQRF